MIFWRVVILNMLLTYIFKNFEYYYKKGTSRVSTIVPTEIQHYVQSSSYIRGNLLSLRATTTFLRAQKMHPLWLRRWFYLWIASMALKSKNGWKKKKSFWVFFLIFGLCHCQFSVPFVTSFFFVLQWSTLVSAPKRFRAWHT